MVALRVAVAETESLPRGYGIAYLGGMERTRIAVCYPIPFNLVVGWTRAVYHWLTFPPWIVSYLDRRMEREYRRGRAEGEVLGQGKAQFTRALDAELRRKFTQ